MKKTLTLFCVATAAALQALTLDWATDNQSRSIGVDEDFSIVTTYTPGSTTVATGWTTLVSIRAYDASGTVIDDVLRAQYQPGASEITVYGNVNDNFSRTIGTIATAANETMRIIVNKEGNTVSVYANGQSVLTFDIDQYIFGDVASYQVFWSNQGELPGTVGDSGTYDDALTDWEIGEVSNPDVHPQAIPEPTALALLALGVAAVALRRRA